MLACSLVPGAHPGCRAPRGELADCGAARGECTSLQGFSFPTPNPYRLAGEEAVQRVLGAWATADLFPDVPPALRDMHAGGYRLCVLTNGSGAREQWAVGRDGGLRRWLLLWRLGWGARIGPRLVDDPSHPPLPSAALLCSCAADAVARPVLSKAGVEGCFEKLLDINMVGEGEGRRGEGGALAWRCLQGLQGPAPESTKRSHGLRSWRVSASPAHPRAPAPSPAQANAWKPSPASYAYAVQQLGLTPEEVCIVRVGGWAG